MNDLSQQLAQVHDEIRKRAENKHSTVVGIVCPKTKQLKYSLKKVSNKWLKTTCDPDVYLAEKLEPVLKSRKRFIIIIGGRGSGKSVGASDILLVETRDNGTKVYCLREFMSSIKNSVKNLIASEIKRLEFDGFEVMQNSIKFKDEDTFEFAGLQRNVDSIKSTHGIGRYWIEESQFITDESLTALTPTMRNLPNKGLPRESDEIKQIDEFKNSSMIFVANPGSSESPFSKRFINPYKDVLDTKGIYEDDLHLIVMMNYVDNPWYEDSGLEKERLWDLEHRSRDLYGHIWLGEPSDSVEDALILAEWFDACIDAHIKIGFKPLGGVMAAHDPSDQGGDAKSYVERQGSVIIEALEQPIMNVNEGCDWATGMANQRKVDHFTWDGDGLGASLAAQISKAFVNTHTKVAMYRGSEGVDYPNAMSSQILSIPIHGLRKNKDIIKNKRAQYYLQFRERCYKTYRRVVHGEEYPIEELISFSSEIKLLSKLKSEVCRMPIKPNANGLFQLYTKEEMKKSFKINSPNLADGVVMTLRLVNTFSAPKHIPPAIRPIGIGRR